LDDIYVTFPCHDAVHNSGAFFRQACNTFEHSRSGLRNASNPGSNGVQSRANPSPYEQFSHEHFSHASFPVLSPHPA
jgi:hypothetical protein